VWSCPPRNPALTYELTPGSARVVFRVLDPVFIQWNHMDQSIIVKTPRRYAAKPVWCNSRGQVTQPLARTRDYGNFLHIPGLHIIQKTGVRFRFTPACMYRELPLEDRVIVDNGIKIRLTRTALTQQVAFPKGVYLGRPYVTTDFHINSC